MKTPQARTQQALAIRENPCTGRDPVRESSILGVEPVRSRASSELVVTHDRGFKNQGNRKNDPIDLSLIAPCRTRIKEWRGRGMLEAYQSKE